MSSYCSQRVLREGGRSHCYPKSTKARYVIGSGVLITVLQNSLTCQGSHFAKRPRYARSGCVGFLGLPFTFRFCNSAFHKTTYLVWGWKTTYPNMVWGFPMGTLSRPFVQMASSHLESGFFYGRHPQIYVALWGLLCAMAPTAIYQ